jgi:hypothetical protein
MKPAEHLGTKKKRGGGEEYLKGKINELETNNKNRKYYRFVQRHK